MTLTPPPERPFPNLERALSELLGAEVRRTGTPRMTAWAASAAAAALVVGGGAWVSAIRHGADPAPAGPGPAVSGMATDDLVLQTRQLSADQALAWAQMCADNANRPDYAIPTLSPVSVEPATLRYAYDLRAPGAASTERSVAFTDPRTHVVYGCVGRSDLTTASAVYLYGPAATFARLKSCVYPPDTRYPITPNDESYQLNGISGQSTERVRASGWFRVGPEVARVRQRVTMPGQVPGAWVSSVAGPDLVYVEAWGTEALETGGTSATEPGSVEIQAFDADGNLLTPPPDQRDGCVLSPAAGTSARHSFNPHGG